jgi:hypothetical protein
MATPLRWLVHRSKSVRFVTLTQGRSNKGGTNCADARLDKKYCVNADPRVSGHIAGPTVSGFGAIPVVRFAR